MELTLPDTNGHPPADPWEAEAQRLDEFMDVKRAELRDMLGQERALVARIQAALDTCKEREKRVLRALAALEGQATAGRPPQAKTPSSHDWTPRPQTVAKAYEALVALGEGRCSHVAQRAGMSDQTTRRALQHLRAEERVRVVRNSKNNGPTFAPMPNTDGAWAQGEPADGA